MKLLFFRLPSCPYCISAQKWLDELIAEDSRYADIEIETILENERPELAESYDYYYVPTFYLGNCKLHEGAATKEKIRAVLDECIAQE